MPDGHATAIFANNALANGLDMRRVVIVGVHNAEVDSNGTRIEELLLGYNAARYDAFMRFITHDLAKKVEGDETPRLRLAAGYSNGGAWAYDALNSGGGRFGGAIVMSPGQWKTRSEAPLHGHLAFVGAGQLEPRFLAGARSIASDLKARGASVKEVEVPSGHSMNTWVNVWNLAITELDRQPK
jgi:predicted esterase